MSETAVRSQVDGPDFICIGMARSATGWLYDQLAHHPDFWMPPIKEMRYLGHEGPGFASHASNRLRKWKKHSRRAPRGRQQWQERDREFLLDAASIGEERDLEKYVWLFRHKAGQLSGDISPAYAQLPDSEVRRVAIELPNVKILFFIRDPVSRAWSRICLAHRKGDFDETLLQSPRQFRDFLETAKMLRERSHPTRVSERWARCAPAIPFRHYFFDDVRDTPNLVRHDLLQFLGADPSKSSGQLGSDHNRKADSPKLPLPEDIKTILVEHFEEEIVASARIYGGRATEWCMTYGLAWHLPAPSSWASRHAATRTTSAFFALMNSVKNLACSLLGKFGCVGLSLGSDKGHKRLQLRLPEEHRPSADHKGRERP